MRWDEVLDALVATVDSDPEMLAMLGGPHVYETADIRELRIPSIGWTLVDDGDDEATDTVLVQWDVFAPVLQIADIEAHLRRLVSWRTECTVGGLRMTGELRGGRSHPVETVGQRHRSFDVLYSLTRKP